MWIAEITSFPDDLAVLHRGKLVGQKERVALQRMSDKMYALGVGRELMLVLGVLPSTLLSPKSMLWMLFLEGARPTTGHLRKMRTIFQWFVGSTPQSLWAEVDFGDEAARRFIEFMGAQHTDDNSIRHVYEWSK